MAKNKKISTYRDLSGYHWSLNQIKAGNRIIYLHEAQYPLLEVQVVLRERSREQMGLLELTILKLLKVSSLQPGVLAALLGFSESRLFNLVKELQGRSLLGYMGDELTLTRLGMMSIQHGYEVVEVKRALLLCGITGRLMPAAAYEQQLESIDRLGVYSPVLIDEAQNVPLAHLAITDLQDKRAYNLPDEALEVVNVIAHEPKFLRGTLALYESPGQKVHGEFCFADSVIDWLEGHELLGFVEPIEWRYKDKKDKKIILEEICGSLAKIGCAVASSDYDADGNPLVNLTAMSDAALQESIYGRSLAFFIGTRQHQAVPIIRFPQKGDMLSGHPLRLYAISDRLQTEVNLLRETSDAMDTYYKTVFGQRQGSVQEYVLQALSKAGYTQEEWRSLVNRLDLSRFVSLFKQ